MLRWALRMFAILVFAVLLMAVWNLAAAEWQHTKHPVPGSFYTVAGKKMHLYCTGAGSPTVVISPGLGEDWLNWQNVQPKLATTTRVCTYDRAGLGWSEPREGLHDAEAMARHLHELLAAAGEKAPYVMVGASAGGFYVREYDREFPNDVAAIVFSDSSIPDQLDRLPGYRASYEKNRQQYPKDERWSKLRVWTGWARLRGRCHQKPEKGLERMAADFDAEMCRDAYEGADLPEYMDFGKAGEQAGRVTTFGDIPLLVVSQDPDRPKPGWDENSLKANPIWADAQEGLKSLSAKSWRVVAKGAGHHIHGDRPDVLVKEIGRMVEFVRGGPAPPFGTTTVE